MHIDAAIFRRRRISLTSLIDVIFLLLLFFMLSSTFTRFAEIEVTGGAASASAAGERPDVLIALDDQGGWRINGVALPDESEAMAELARLEAAGAGSAVLLVRGELSSQALVGAVESVRAATGLALTLAR